MKKYGMVIHVSATHVEKESQKGSNSSTEKDRTEQREQ